MRRRGMERWGVLVVVAMALASGRVAAQRAPTAVNPQARSRGPSPAFRLQWRAQYDALLAEREDLADAPPRNRGLGGHVMGLLFITVGAGIFAADIERERCGGILDFEIGPSYSDPDCTIEPMGRRIGGAFMGVGLVGALAGILGFLASRRAAVRHERRLREVDELLRRLRRVGPLHWNVTASLGGSRFTLAARF